MKIKIILLLNLIFTFFIYMNIYSFPDEYTIQLEELNNALALRGVPANWLYDNINDSNFIIYKNIENYFVKSPEHKVSTQEKDFDWYKNYFDVDTKIKHGLEFIEKNIDTLKRIEAKNGIPYELVIAVFGMETHYGAVGNKKGFYVFCTLVSHYLLIPKRKNYAINELAALYKFSIKIDKPVYYFIGSFAGASGLAQFIPSSLLRYFTNANNDDNSMDIYSTEDTLFSIENYLFNAGLNKFTIKNQDAIYKAIFLYNPSDAYTKTVIYIYNEIKKQTSL